MEDPIAASSLLNPTETKKGTAQISANADKGKNVKQPINPLIHMEGLQIHLNKKTS